MESIARLLEWWASVPSWAKPIILGAVISVATAFLRWVVPYMIKRLYIWVLQKRQTAEKQIRSERLSDGLLNVRVLPNEVQDRMGIPAWLVRRAERWEQRYKQYGVS